MCSPSTPHTPPVWANRSGHEPQWCGQEPPAPPCHRASGCSAWGRSCHRCPQSLSQPGPFALRQQFLQPDGALAVLPAQPWLLTLLFRGFVWFGFRQRLTGHRLRGTALPKQGVTQASKKTALLATSDGLRLSPGVRRRLRSQKPRAGGPAGLQKQLWHRIHLTDGRAARQELRPPHPSAAVRAQHRHPPRAPRPAATHRWQRHPRHVRLHVPPCYCRVAHGAAMPQPWLMLAALLL